MRIVVKVGTNVLADEVGIIDESRLENIVSQVTALWKAKHEVIVVNSGAVGIGRIKLPDVTVEAKEQVWAAIGQPFMFQFYAACFAKYGFVAAQCLFLRDDFTDRERYDNVKKVLEDLLRIEILPIVNENDVIVSENATIGNNDLLAAMVAIAVRADKLILLTNQKGLYTSNPETDREATLIPLVTNVDRELEKMCSKETSSFGTGGMLSKVRAAKQAVHAGIETYIAHGGEPNVLAQILAGEAVGTKFPAQGITEVSEQKRWLMAAKGFGQLVVDEGAAKALAEGKSLLLPGIVATKGLFDEGEIVEVISKTGSAVAYGKVNYRQAEIFAALAKRKSEKGKTTLAREVIHRDHMVVLQK